MNITTEELKTLYERSREYAVACGCCEPNFIELNADGTIYAINRTFFEDGYEDDTFKITAKELTEDLDALIKAREEKLRQEKIEFEKREKEAKRISEERAKNERRKQYEELKKEFEP